MIEQENRMTDFWWQGGPFVQRRHYLLSFCNLVALWPITSTHKLTWCLLLRFPLSVFCAGTSGVGYMNQPNPFQLVPESCGGHSKCLVCSVNINLPRLWRWIRLLSDEIGNEYLSCHNSILDTEGLGSDSVIMQWQVKRTGGISKNHVIDRKLPLESNSLGSNPAFVSYKLCVLEKMV